MESFMDEQLRLEAEEARAAAEMLAGEMTEEERAEQMENLEAHNRQKGDMLKSQLDIYGKPQSLSRKKKSKKKASKKERHADPEEEPSPAEARRSKKKGASSSRKHGDANEDDAERRRQSRAAKAAELIRAMNEDEDAEEPSLLERLDANKKRRSKRRDGDVDSQPLSVTLWVYMLFSIVALDRTIKYLSNHADPVIVSKVLGVVLIVASFGVKVPQIMSVMESKTVEGLSAPKFYTGVVSLTLVVVYHVANRNPFPSWGDSLAVLGQDMTLVGLIWKYSRTPVGTQVALGAAYAVFCVALAVFALKTRPDKLWPLPLLSTVIAHSGSIPQIIANERNRHTGPQSFVTQLMLTLGSLARVFTTLSEMNDPVVLMSFVSSVFVQGILLVQILMYWANTKRVLAQSRKSKAE